jgi:hypothetical protein
MTLLKICCNFIEDHSKKSSKLNNQTDRMTDRQTFINTMWIDEPKKSKNDSLEKVKSLVFYALTKNDHNTLKGNICFLSLLTQKISRSVLSNTFCTDQSE